MNIAAAFSLFAIIIVIYMVIAELFTILFRFTGLPDEKARFQVISLLTGCGFTTRESEMIISSRSRRRLARIAILFGYVFNVTIVSTLVNLFISVKTTQVEGILGGLLIPLGALAIIFIFMRVRVIRAFFDHVMEKLAGSFLRGEHKNSVQIVDYIGRSSIAQVALHVIPEAFADKPLSQTGLRSEHGILVMLIETGGKEAAPATADTVFRPGDKLTVFGDYRTVCRVFDARERFTDEG